MEMDASISSQIAQWLSDTTSSNESAVRSATAHLELAQQIPVFAATLLDISTMGKDQAQRTAAITYLKNYVRNHLNDSKLGDPNGRLEFRNQFVQLLLQVDTPVLSLFAELFHLIVMNDFVREKKWPELIPFIRTSIQNSDMIVGAANSSCKTLNSIVALQMLVKPFQYFMNPTMAREPVPEQLELVTKDLLVPAYEILHHFVEQSMISQGFMIVEDKCILTLCKCFHLAVRSHMPACLIPHLGAWHRDFLMLLNSVNLEEPLEEAKKSRLKASKRVLQIFCTLVTRHRKYSDKFMPDMISSSLRIIRQHVLNDQFFSLRERLLSTAFDVVSHVLETGPGWRLVAPHFSSLLETVIFPALRLNEKDMYEWVHDTDEYLAKNLPSEMDETSGWKEDSYTARKSALNLMSVIALSKGPPLAGTSNKTVAGKRKKNRGKSNRLAGELLIIPFLSKFPLPVDSSSSDMEAVRDYYGVLLAYGSLQELFKVQPAQYVILFLRNRVLPLYLMSSPSPYLIANANWLLGELAGCLPEDVNQEIYSSLLKAFVAPNVGNISWYPVRASAAGALGALLQEEYIPMDWSDFLQICVDVMRKEEDVCLPLRLLNNAAESGLGGAANHIPDIISSINREILKHIPSAPNPWPQVVELGFSAIAALAKCWDDAEPNENIDSTMALEDWKHGCVSVAIAVSNILQKAWLSHLQDDPARDILPPPSSLNDASVLLRLLMKYTTDQECFTRYKVKALLQVWADLIAEWKAWEEEEDIAVFEAIHQASTLNEKIQMKEFIVSTVPPPPAPPIAPRSIAEGIAQFTVLAVELAYSAAAWRACYISHSLLHLPNFSCESEGLRRTLAIRFTQAAYARYQKLRSTTVPLAKPLLLVIAACYLHYPGAAEKVLVEENESKDSVNGFLKWAEAFVCLVKGNSELALTLESEFKLAVMSLARVLDNLLALENSPAAMRVAYVCIQSLLEALIKLKEIQEAKDMSDEDVDDNDDDSDDEDDLESDEDEEDSDEDECEETQEQFLERYAQTARDLEKEITENADGGEEEDGKEIELGHFSKENPKNIVLSLIQKHHDLIKKQSLTQEAVARLLENLQESTESL